MTAPLAPDVRLSYATALNAAATVFHFNTTTSVSHVFAGTDGDSFPTTELTLAFWVKTADTNANSVLFAYTPQNAPTPLLTVSNPANLTVTYRGATPVVTATPINDGQWHHVLLTVAPNGRSYGAIQVLLDGVPVLEAPKGFVHAAGDWFVAAGIAASGLAGAGTGFTGDMSELQLWSAALGDQQAATLLQRRAAPGSDALALVWGFYDAGSTGTTVGADPDPFVASTLQFRSAASGRGAYVQATWTAVSGATSYDFEIYADDGSWVWTLESIAASSLPLNIDGVLLDESYQARARSLAGSDTGAWSAPVALAPIDLNGIVPVFSWPAAADPLLATWQPPDQAQSYLLLQSRDPPQSPPATPTASSATSVDLTADLEGDFGWTVGVEGVASSSIGPVETAGAISAPAMAFYYLDDGKGVGGSGSFEFSWTALTPQPTYLYFEVRKGNATILSQVFAGTQASPVDFPSPVAVAIGDVLTGVMRVLGSAAITHLATRTITAQDIAQPQLAWQAAASPQNEALQMVWGAVADGATYNLALYQDLGPTPIVSQTGVSVPSYAMTPYLSVSPSHSYNMLVNAVVEGQVGPASAVVTPPALASSLTYVWTGAPTNSGVLALSWTADPTPGLSVYLRFFVNGAATPSIYNAVPFASGLFTLAQPEGGYPDGTQLSYAAYGLGEGYMALPESGSATLHRLDQPVVSLSGDSTNQTLVATWPAVDPSIDGVLYRILIDGTAQGTPQVATSFALTSYLSAANATTFQTQATLDNSFGQPSAASAAPATTPGLRYNYAPDGADTLSATWTAAPIVYLQVQLQGQPAPVATELDTAGGSSFEVPRPPAGYSEGQVYTVSTKSAANATVGAFSQASAAIHQLAAPVVTFAQAPDPASVIAQWSDIRNPQQQQENLAVDYQVRLDAQNQGAPQAALSYTFTGLLDQAGAQAVTVQGQAQGSYGLVSTPTTLTAPSALTLAYDEVSGVLSASWPAVAGAQQYCANVMDGQNAIFARNWIVPATPSVATNFTPGAPVEGATYTVNARVLAGGMLTAFSTASVIYRSVPGPSIAEPMRDDSANSQIVASWTFEPAAFGLSNVIYIVELHALDGSLIGAPVQTSNKTANLAYGTTPVGTTLEVRVRATGNGLLGSWSAYVSIAIGSGLTKPVISSFSFDAENAMTITWGAVTSPEPPTPVTYSVTVTGSGLKSDVFPKTTTGTSLTLSQATTGVEDETVYTATVQATGPGTKGPVSAAKTATTNKLTSPNTGGGGGDEGGDPIGMATGFYSYSHGDFGVVGVIALDFTTYYTSAMPLPSEDDPIASDKPMGKRWSHSYNTRLYIPNPQPDEDPYVAVVWGYGMVAVYDWRNTIGVLTKQGRQDGNVFTRNADLTYTLVLKNQTRYNFDGLGRLTAIVSNFGNVTALSYSGSQLQRVTDNGSGRYLAFAYYNSGVDSGRLKQVGDNAGRHVGYAYTDGDLTSFTNVLGKSRVFSYWPQSLMKQASYENGDVIVYNEYDDQQRVKLQRDGNQMAAGGQLAYTIGWTTGTTSNNFATTIAAVQDYAGHQIVYTSLTESQDTVSTVYTLANGTVWRCLASYDGNGNVLSQTVYEGAASGDAALGNTISASYDGNFNLLTLTFSGGMGSAAFGYDSRNNLTSYTDILGNTTTSSFNADNTLGDVRDALGARTAYTYKAGAIKGLVETVSVYPANGQGGAANTANVTRLTYTGLGQIETVTNALGETTIFGYDAATGWTSSTSIANADGTIVLALTYIRYPQSGQVTTRKTRRYNQPLSDASTEILTHDDRGNLYTVTDALGRTTQYVYNPNNFLKTIVYPPEGGLSEQTSFDYTGANLIQTLTLSSADPNVAWGFGYDAVGRLTSRTDPNANTTSFATAMNASQSPAAPTVRSQIFPLLVGAPKPYVQSLTVDSLDRPIAVSDIIVQGTTGGTTTLAYATLNDQTTGAHTLQITKTLPLADPGQQNPYTDVSIYDAYNRVIAAMNAAGKAWTAAYTPAVTSNPVTVQTVATVTDPLGNQTVTVTDAAGRIVARKRGRPAQDGTAAQWMTTAVSYNADGYPSRVVETGSDGMAQPATTYVYAYDASEHVLNVTVTPYGDASCQSVYGYDKAMAYVGLESPAGVTETRGYNSRGLLKTYTDGRGNLLQYAYDAAGRFTSTTTPGGDVVANVLDSNGNRLQTTRNGAAEIARVFDTLNRMTSRTDTVMGKTVGYTYTPMNGVATLAYPDVATPLAYAYDGLQRLKSVTDWNARATTYAYWAAGKLQTTTYPNGVIVQQSVDDANRITGFSATLNGSVIASATCQFDAFSRPHTVDQILPIGFSIQGERSFTYDGDRMLTIDGADLAYDDDGDMTTIPGVDGALHYNVLRQLTGVGDATLSYDLDGLHTGLAQGATARRFVKDPRNYRAPLIDQADPTSAVNAAAQISSAAGPLSIAPLAPPASNAKPLSLLPARPPTLGPEQSDPFESLPVPNADPYGAFSDMLDRTLVAEDADGSNRVRYVYGQGLVSREADDGTWQSYVFDGQGNTLALVDGTGTITDRFAYSSYGAILARQGTTSDPFLYNGRYGVADHGIGPLLMRFRSYEPSALRFTSRDLLYGNSSAPQTQNRYAYTLGDPVQLIDPLGLGGDKGNGGNKDKKDSGLPNWLRGIIIAGIAIVGIIVIGVLVVVGLVYLAPEVLTALGSSLVARFGTTLLGRLGSRILSRFPRVAYKKFAEAAEEIGTQIEMEEVAESPINSTAYRRPNAGRASGIED